MQIVIYKAQGKGWQLCRKGDSKSPFYTTSALSNAAKFSDGRSAAGWLRRCQRYARNVLGWRDAIFKRVSEYDFEDGKIEKWDLDKTESQTDRITQLESSCAAMRECLSCFADGNADQDTSEFAAHELITSTDSGKALLDHLQQLEQRVESDARAELEAACAAMRELLLKWVEYFRNGEGFTDLESKTEDALSSDAGKSLLDRLQTAESALAPIKSELTEWQIAFAMFKGTPNELAAWAVRDAARLQAVDKAHESIARQLHCVQVDRDRLVKAWELGRGRVHANFGHVPAAIRACDWIEFEMQKALQPAKEQ